MSWSNNEMPIDFSVFFANMLNDPQGISPEFNAVLAAAHAKFVRDQTRARYHSDAGFRAASIKRATARMLQKRQDPVYVQHERELQRIRRQRLRDARVVIRAGA